MSPFLEGEVPLGPLFLPFPPPPHVQELVVAPLKLPLGMGSVGVVEVVVVVVSMKTIEG